MKQLPFLRNLSPYDLLIIAANNFNEDDEIFNFNSENNERGIEIIKNTDKKHTNHRWKLSFLSSNDFIIAGGHHDNSFSCLSDLSLKIMMLNDFKRLSGYSKLTNKQLKDLQSKGYWE